MSNLNTLYNEMNIFLANDVVASMKVHNLHWNITGNKFFTLHPKLDQYYDEILKRIDEVAERLLTIGGPAPVGTLHEVLEIATLPEFSEAKKFHGDEVITVLIDDFSQIRNGARRLIEIATELNDYGTADYFTGVIQALEKELWMLNAYSE